MANELENKIIHQVEYYFGDINLPRDKFMQEKVKEDEGWITLEVLLTFKRLANLSKDQEVIANALEKSETGLIEVSEDKKKVRRNPDLPVPELNDARKKELMTRTAYAKGFPLTEEFNEIITFLEPHGPIESCIRRSHKDHKFKGSCFIIFKDLESCKKFVEEPSMKYKDTELIRKWQNDYFAEKKRQYEERVKAKKDKRQAKLDEACKQIKYPRGAVLHFSGIPEEKSLTREDIKEKLTDDLKDVNVAFIDFNKGDTSGYIRLTPENAAPELFKQLTDGELEVKEVKIKFRVLEGDEEETYLKNSAEIVAKIRQKNKGNRKRKGHFSNGRDATKVRKNE